MRDQVLQLLLSGQKSQRSTTRAARTSLPSSRDRRIPFEAWTPGAHLGNSNSEAAVLSPPAPNRRNNDPAGGDIGILSPITPETRGGRDIGSNGTNSNGNFNGPSYARLPMDADLRLAEITAGLVAATDKERRQTDTIRRLAIQLERSENQVKILQKTPPESTPPARRKSRKRREDNYHNGDGDENGDAQYELEELRRQRREWRQKDKMSKKEARAAANLLTDIRRSAERVLAERDGHLRVIASLQQQLHERMNGVDDDTSIRAENTRDSIDIPSRRAQVAIPPRPALSETSQTTYSGKSQSNRRNHLPAAGASPRKVVVEQYEETDTNLSGKQRQHMRSPGSTQSERIIRPQERISRSGSLPNIPSCTPNGQGGGGNTIVDAEADGETVGQTESGGGQTQLYQDLHELLAENKALKASLESRPANQVVHIPEELEELEDELGALESVVEAMELSLSTDEAKEMQLTMSTLGLGFEDKKTLTNLGGAKSLAERIKDVKDLIASKYGRYLADFGPSSDDTLSLPPGVMLDSLQEPTEVSLSRTVAPEADDNNYGGGFGRDNEEENDNNALVGDVAVDGQNSVEEESSASRVAADDVNDVQ